MPTHYYKANKTLNGQQNLKKKKKRCRNGHTPAGKEEKETKKKKKKNNNINKVPDSSIHLILIIFYRKAFEICWYTKKTKKTL